MFQEWIYEWKVCRIENLGKEKFGFFVAMLRYLGLELSSRVHSTSYTCAVSDIFDTKVVVDNNSVTKMIFIGDE